MAGSRPPPFVKAHLQVGLSPRSLGDGMSTVIASSMATLPAATAAAAARVEGSGVGWGKLPPPKVVAMTDGGLVGSPYDNGAPST